MYPEGFYEPKQMLREPINGNTSVLGTIRVQKKNRAVAVFIRLFGTK
jgi:hypothetical protein